MEKNEIKTLIEKFDYDFKQYLSEEDYDNMERYLKDLKRYEVVKIFDQQVSEKSYRFLLDALMSLEDFTKTMDLIDNQAFINYLSDKNILERDTDADNLIDLFLYRNELFNFDPSIKDIVKKIIDDNDSDFFLVDNGEKFLIFNVGDVPVIK